MDSQQTSQFRKDFALAVQTFKQAVSAKTDKVRKLITDWLIKWADYLRREGQKHPYHICRYSSGEIVLVDLGFRIGNELGGRHYAVVVEKNNNPHSGVIFLAPISSYDVSAGETPRINNIDLGIGAISSPQKGAEVVISQIGAYSKIRIVKSLHRKIEKNKYNEIVDALYKKIEKKK